MKNKMAKTRTTKLTQEVSDQICKNIRNGLTYEQAATYAGVTRRSLQVWKAKGEIATSGIHYDFNKAVQKAGIEARVLHLSRINKAALVGEEFDEVSIIEKIEIDRVTGLEIVVGREKRITKKKVMPQWQASAWILERRHPAEFGRFVVPKADEGKDPLDQWRDDLQTAEQEFGGIDEFPES